MISVVIFVFGLLYLMRNHDLDRLLGLRIKLWWLILLSAALQVATEHLSSLSPALAERDGALYLLSHILLLIGVLANRHIVGFMVIAAGVFANALVMALNGGFMPVSLEALEEAGLGDRAALLVAGGYLEHAALDASTRLPFLGDIIPLGPPLWFRAEVVSVGDVLVILGLVLTVFLETRPRPARG